MRRKAGRCPSCGIRDPALGALAYGWIAYVVIALLFGLLVWAIISVQ